MSEETNLTGRWTGVYFYPEDGFWNANDNYPPTPFAADLVDDLGLISGTTLEPDLTGPVRHAEIRASLEGRRSASELSFTKYPDSPRQDPIHYAGIVSADGNSIEGTWIIPGEWSGTFRMKRKVAPVSVRKRAAENARN